MYFRTGYSVYSVTDASAMYTPATAGYYTGGNATAYSQVKNLLLYTFTKK